MPDNLPDCLSTGLDGHPSWRIPLDEHDVAVRLECDGITNEVAAAHYGFPGVHAMAHSWYPRVSGLAEGQLGETALSNQVLEHLRGTAFAVPLALCCAVMIYFGYSLWGGDLESGAAAAVAIGTVASFVVTGGVVQAMAWQGLFYAGSGDFRMSAVACHRWTCYGAVVLAATAAAGVLINAQYGWLSGNMLWLALAFFLSLGLLWLGTGILYIVDAPLKVTVAALCGVAVVLILHGLLRLPLIMSQIAGVLTASGIAFAAGLRILGERHKGDSSRIYPRKIMHTVYLTAPYLVYGSLYYALLFLDRLMAWTAQTAGSAIPLIFRGDYELPHDIALIGFVLSVGWAHASTRSFYVRVQALLRTSTLDRTAVFNNRMRKFHLMKVVSFLPAAWLVNLGLWLIAREAGFLVTPQAERIAAVALAAFPLLTVGLWNVSLLFALSLPWAVLPPAIAAVVLNGSSGYALSRVGTYDLAIFGFLLGAAAFGIGSSIVVRNRFERLDYFYLVAGV